MKNRNLSGADAGRYAEGRANARQAAFDHFGSPQGVMAAMYPYMFQDTKFHIDDFEGAELDPNLWSYDSDSGIELPWSLDSSYVWGGTSPREGAAISIYGPETLQPSKNCGVEWRFQVAANGGSGYQLEIGFVNRLAGEPRQPIISDVDGPTAVTNNTGAVFHFDTTQDLETGAFVLSSNAGATVSKTNVATFEPTADNWYTLRVQSVFDGSAGYKAHYYLWDSNSSRMNLVSSGHTSISGTTAATSYYRPWFLVRTQSDIEKLARIDYCARWSDR